MSWFEYAGEKHRSGKRAAEGELKLPAGMIRKWLPLSFESPIGKLVDLAQPGLAATPNTNGLRPQKPRFAQESP